MSLLPPVIVSLIADSKEFTAKMDEAQAKMAETETSGGGSLNKLQSVGKTALLGVSGAAVAVGVASVDMGEKFQASMTALVTGAGESEANMKKVSAGILSMAPSVGATTKELADGMYLIESAGYHGAQGLSVLNASAQGAKVGNASLATVAGAVTTALTDYQIPASRATQVTSALVQTVADGKTHMEALGASLGRVMPLASSMGVSFQDVTGALATMTNAGLTAKLASQNLANAIRSLAAPGPIAQDAMISVGLSAQQLKDTLSNKGLGAALQDVEEHVGNTFPKSSVAYTSAMKDIMGGAVGLNVALMLGGTHMSTYEANVKSIGGALDGAGGHVQGFAKVQGDLGFQIDQARATVEVLGTRLGLLLLPVIEKVMSAVAGLVGWLMKHQDVAIALGAVIGGVLVVAITAYTVSMISAAVATVAAALPILAIVAAVALLAFAVYDLVTHWSDIWNTIKDVTTTVVGTVISFVEGIPGKLVGALASLADDLGKLVSDAWNGVKRITTTLVSDYINFYTALPGKIIDALGDIGKLLVGWIKDGWHAFQDADADFVNNTLQPFITGLPGKVLGWLGDIGKDLVKWIKDGWHAFQDADTDFVNNTLKPFITGLPGKVLGWLGDIGSLLVKWIKAGWHSFQDADTDFVNNTLMPFIQGLPDRILNALGDIGSLLYNAGKNIIQGLINGITDAFGGVKDTLGNLTNDLTSWKGPPARDAILLAENGRLVIQGFIDGIVSKVPDVQSTLGGLTAMVGASSGGSSATFAGLGASLVNPASSTPSGGAGGLTVGPTTINATFHGTPQTMLREMQAMLDEHDQEMMRTLIAARS
jgi:TP901 family phage tail tape measure protein